VIPLRRKKEKRTNGSETQEGEEIGNESPSLVQPPDAKVVDQTPPAAQVRVAEPEKPESQLMEVAVVSDLVAGQVAFK